MPASPAAERALQRIRRLCLALPETSEMLAWGHPVFKAGKKTFAALEPIKGRPSIAVRLDPVDVDLLVSGGGVLRDAVRAGTVGQCLGGCSPRLDARRQPGRAQLPDRRAEAHVERSRRRVT